MDTSSKAARSPFTKRKTDLNAIERLSRTKPTEKPEMPVWSDEIARHQEPRTMRSVWQLVNTLLPYAALMGLMVWLAPRAWWLTLILAIPTGALFVRLFVLFHDCAHGSFFHGSRGNDFWGTLLGILTFTPYREWRYTHALHHATSGDLDRRGTGDIWTLTVQEYLEASRWKRFAYRLVRNPFVLFVVVPVCVFVGEYRFPRRVAAKRERLSVYLTNAALFGIVTAASLTVGIKTYLLVQLSVLMVAGMIGVWLFYVQHQFEGVYWQRSKDWDFVEAALNGSSFYQLPGLLQWFTGSIGFHHVHHLSPAIPNYNLERCHREHEMFHSAKTLTLGSSLKSLTFRLWDEQRGKLVSYGRLRELRREGNIRTSSP
jgi:omega-6 fatty acid desaturase (delta-12 desaturase)